MDSRNPPVALVVEARSMASHDSSSSVHSYEVHKPMSIGRQRDQLVRAALKRHPAANLASMDDGVATLFSHTHMIVASYGEAGRARAKDKLRKTSAFVEIPV